MTAAPFLRIGRGIIHHIKTNIMFTRIALTFYLAVFSVAGLFAQEGGITVPDTPNRQSVQGTGEEAWYTLPFVWISLLLVLLVVVLLVLRNKKKATTTNRLHKY